MQSKVELWNWNQCQIQTRSKLGPLHALKLPSSCVRARSISARKLPHPTALVFFSVPMGAYRNEIGAWCACWYAAQSYRVSTCLDSATRGSTNLAKRARYHSIRHRYLGPFSRIATKQGVDGSFFTVDSALKKKALNMTLCNQLIQTVSSCQR